MNIKWVFSPALAVALAVVPLAAAPLACASPASDSLPGPDLSPWLEGADVVARVHIEEASVLWGEIPNARVRCGVRALATVVDAPQESTERLEFRLKTGTVGPGEEYVVFLHHANGGDGKPGQETDDEAGTARRLSRSRQMQAACEQYRGGYEVTKGSVWPVMHRWSDEEGESEAWVAFPTGLKIPGTTPFTFLQLHVHSLQIAGDVVPRGDWDSADRFDGLPPVPSEILDYDGAMMWDGFNDYLKDTMAAGVGAGVIGAGQADRLAGGL